MPDLVTHAAVGWLAARSSARLSPALIVAGSFAPDLMCRVPALVANTIHIRLVHLPPALLYGWEPLHTPIGFVLSSYVLAHLFAERARRRVFLNLLAGMSLHLALDLLQDHWGVGTALFFPLSFQDYELGWIGSESSVFAAPVLAAGVGLWMWWEHRKIRIRRSSRS